MGRRRARRRGHRGPPGDRPRRPGTTRSPGRRAIVAARTRNASPGAVPGRASCSTWRAPASTATRSPPGTAAEDDALADLLMSDELRGRRSTRSTWCSKRAKRPAGAPDKALARPVTKVGVVGAGLMACQLALLFVRRLQVPVVLTDLDQARVDKGVGLRARRDRQAGRQGPAQRGQAQPAQGPGHRLADQGRLRRRRPRDRGRLRGAVGQEAGVRRGRGGRLARVRAGDQHLVAVGHRDGRRSWSTRSGSSGLHFFNPVAVLPLLEIVRAEQTDDATLATAFAVGKALKKTCVLVEDAPAFVVNRLLTRFLGEVTAAVDAGHPGGRGRPRARPAGPADEPVRPAHAGRAGGGAARGRADARGVPRPVLRRRGPARRWSSWASRRCTASRASSTPSCAGIDAGRLAAHRGAGARRGPSGRWPRRSG